MSTSKPKKLKCPKCKKPFKTQSRYEHHLNNVQCDKIFTCDKCEKTFDTKGHLVQHQEMKGDCTLKDSRVDSVVCQCGKKFSTNSNLDRHKKTCKEISLNTDKKLLEMLERMEKRLDDLSESKGDTHVTNTINDNRSINITYNTIVLNPFKDFEDLSRLDINMVRQLLIEDPNNYVYAMTEQTHANPEWLENHNIYYDKTKNAIMIYKDNGKQRYWEAISLDIAAQQLTSKFLRYLKSYGMYEGLPLNSIATSQINDGIAFVTYEKKWNSENDLERFKETLGKVPLQEGFLDMVKFQQQKFIEASRVELIPN